MAADEETRIPSLLDYDSEVPSPVRLCTHEQASTHIYLSFTGTAKETIHTDLPENVMQELQRVYRQRRKIKSMYFDTRHIRNRVCANVGISARIVLKILHLLDHPEHLQRIGTSEHLTIVANEGVNAHAPQQLPLLKRLQIISMCDKNWRSWNPLLQDLPSLAPNLEQLQINCYHEKYNDDQHQFDISMPKNCKFNLHGDMDLVTSWLPATQFRPKIQLLIADEEVQESEFLKFVHALLGKRDESSVEMKAASQSQST